PPTVRPTVDDVGMINVPDSMLLLSREGIRRWVPPKALVDMASLGLHRAAAKGEIFHLWFHPSDFVFETERQFQVLETVLQTANCLRNRGALEVLTMGEVQKRVTEHWDASSRHNSSLGYAHHIDSAPEVLRTRLASSKVARGLISDRSSVAAI